MKWLSKKKEEEDDAGITEIRFIPDDKGVLNLLFDALRECQALHPDPEDSFSDGRYWWSPVTRGIWS